MLLFTVIGLAVIIIGVAFLISAAKQGTTKIGPIEGPAGALVIIAGLCTIAFPYSSLCVKQVPAPRASLSSPADGARVSAAHGFRAAGSVKDLGDDSVWIADFDDGYYIDNEADVIDNSWSAVDQDLGDKNQKLPFNLTLRVILATSPCATTLTKLDDGSNNYVQQLPAGCSLIDERTVQVVRR